MVKHHNHANNVRQQSPGLQGSFQVCLDNIGDSKEAQSFLAEGCRPLKTAFAFDSLLLRPAAAGVPPGGQTILW